MKMSSLNFNCFSKIETSGTSKNALKHTGFIFLPLQMFAVFLLGLREAQTICLTFKKRTVLNKPN